MITYAKYAPTSFDQKGAFLPERGNWLVLPVIQTRDSGPLEQSNFASALDILGGESDTVEVHRFGHWGPGWFEIIIASPERESEARAIENRLDNYPILDENDLSEREYKDTIENWECWGARVFVNEIVKVFGLSENTEDRLRNASPDTLWKLYDEVTGGGNSEHSGTEVNFCFHHINTSEFSREDLAKELRKILPRRVKV